MTPRLFLTIVIVIVALGLWSAIVTKWAEWADWWHDQDTARQQRLGKLHFLWMKTVSWLGTRKVHLGKKVKLPMPWFVWSVGALVILIVGFAWPPIPGFTVSAIQLVGILRYTEPESEMITSLRSALGEIIGKDAKGQPPSVVLHGEHPAGGPATLDIIPTPGWKFWGVEVWNNVERAVEKKLTGDWEKVFESDQKITYERLPQLPDFVPMTRELLVELKEKLKLPWYLIPVGPDGLGGWVCVNLREYAHWLITGDNGSGKTTWMGWAGTWLLLFPNDVNVAIIDIKGFGLKRFAGRQGVVYEALPPEEEESFEPFEVAFGWLRREVYRRKAELTKSNTFHKPLVVLWDEAEETVSDATQFGEKVKGAEHPLMVLNAMTVARLARELRIHLVVGTQRADGTSMPTKFRAQLRGRVHFGPTDRPGAEMAVGSADAPRLVNMKGPVGICVAKGLNWIKTTQGLYLANYLNEEEKMADRKLAESMLPPPRSEPLPDWANYGVPEHAPDQTGNGASAAKPASPTQAPTTPAPSSDPPATGNGHRTAEGPLEAIRRNARQRKAAERRQDREVNKFDTTWKYHGTRRGYGQAHCRCPACRAWKAKSDQPVDTGDDNDQVA
jgi:hypothetical protein